jgi:hypothetical protein
VGQAAVREEVQTRQSAIICRSTVWSRWLPSSNLAWLASPELSHSRGIPSCLSNQVQL